MSSGSDPLEKQFEKSTKPICQFCNGLGAIELQRPSGPISIPCKTCSGYGYLLAKGDYVTHEQFQSLMKQEPREMYRLAFKLVWYLGLSSQEVLGIRPVDINIPASTDKLAKLGIKQGSTDSIRVLRSTSKSKDKTRVLPLPKWLKDEILDYVSKYKVKNDQPIISRNRTTVFQRLSKYGNTIGGKKKISTNTLRKGFGIWYLAEGGRLEDLMTIFDHSQITLTEKFLHIEGRKAIKNLVEFQRTHSPYLQEVRE